MSNPAMRATIESPRTRLPKNGQTKRVKPADNRRAQADRASEQINHRRTPASVICRNKTSYAAEIAREEKRLHKPGLANIKNRERNPASPGNYKRQNNEERC